MGIWQSKQSISVLSKLLSDFGNFSCIDILSYSSSFLDSSLVPGEGSLLSLVLELLNELLFSPTDLRWQISEGAELPEWGQFDTSHGIGDILLLGGVIRSGNTFENFKSAQSCGTDSGFVGQHSSNASPEDSWWGSVVDEGSSGVSQKSLSQKLSEFGFVSEQGASDVDSFSSHNNDSLT